MRHERSDGSLFAAAAAAAARGDDLDDSLAELLGLAATHLGATIGAVFIFDPDHDALQLAVTFGLEAEVDAGVASVRPVSKSHDPLADATRARQPLQVDDAGHVGILRSASTALLLPLVVRREGIEVSLGVLALGLPGPLPSPEVLAGVEPVADLAAIAIERALALSLGSERAEWFDRLAYSDPLTGLANRRTLDRLLELEVARAGRQGVALSIALFEVDRLEEIQRDAGNEAADEALRRAAQVLSQSVRLVDTIARYGHDQFMLLAPGSDGQAVAERLVKGIAALAPVEGKAVTVSAGIASFPMDGRTPEELLEVAERAKNAAREAGGGRVVAQQPAGE
jgi:diguanylate cyclase (GGDEF)-like protein